MNIDVLCVLTNSHKILFEEYFIKTIPKTGSVRVKYLDLDGEGNYKSDVWQKAVNTKTEFVTSYLETVENGTFFLFSDVDVQFFSSFDFANLKKELIESEKDILFQKESLKSSNMKINSGFYFAVSSPKLLEFFKQILDALDRSEVKSDQTCINNLLKTSDIRWGYLNPNYYARSHGFPPPENVCCHHANKAGKVSKKIRQLKFVGLYVKSNLLTKKILTFALRFNNMISKLIKKSDLSI